MVKQHTNLTSTHGGQRGHNVTRQGSEKTAYFFCIVEFNMIIFIQQNQVAWLAGFAGLAGLRWDLIVYTLNTVEAITKKINMTRNASIYTD